MQPVTSYLALILIIVSHTSSLKCFFIECSHLVLETQFVVSHFISKNHEPIVDYNDDDEDKIIAQVSALSFRTLSIFDKIMGMCVSFGLKSFGRIHDEIFFVW